MKIAFCFLVYDEIINEELWNTFFKNVDTEKYGIYIHYKVNKPLQYFNRYKISNCINTKYADISLVHAHNLLFEHALNDGCDKFINLSQSCLPFKSFNYIYDFLSKDNFSYFNIVPKTACFPNCNSLLSHYDRDFIYKSSQWFIINREICNAFINASQENIHRFSSIYAPEEIFFITQVFLHKLDNLIITTPNLSIGATTFTKWEGMDYKFPSTKGLKNYTFISQEELDYILNSTSLFGRKFTRDSIGCFLKNKYISFISS